MLVMTKKIKKLKTQNVCSFPEELIRALTQTLDLGIGNEEDLMDYIAQWSSSLQLRHYTFPFLCFSHAKLFGYLAFFI